MDKTLVLLSGGIDSTAALIWAQLRGMSPHALFIYYGQPSGQRECESAIAAIRELGVEFHRADISSTYYGGQPGLFRTMASGMSGGVDNAFVPVRNPALLSTAAARALTLWPDQHVRLVVGFNAGDAAGFPDCSAAFIAAFERAINIGLGRPSISVSAPWVDTRKSDIVRWVAAEAPDRMPLIQQSWSCYRSGGPCGECTACVTRASALP